MKRLLEAFAEEVGSTGPVCCAGGRTHWDVGGEPEPGTREVVAPSGIVAHEPAEMIVRVRAGTPLRELNDALGEGGQCVALEADDAARATVGGVLAVGRSGVRRLGSGPVRDSLLEITAVSSRGEVIRAGAPLVKNVTGYDLCRLIVGSLGTLALTAEVVLRCRPLPETERWWVAEGVDPFALAADLYRPQSVLWDGARTWVALAGFEVDVEDQYRQVLGDRFIPVEGAPDRPGTARLSRPPVTLRDLPRLAPSPEGGWLAEVGVGVVHCRPDVAAAVTAAAPPAPPAPELVTLHRNLKARFDPSGRLNPGRAVAPWAGAGGGEVTAA